MSGMRGGTERWAFAILASVLVHAVILGFFFAPGCDASPPTESAPQQVSAETNPPPASVSTDARASVLSPAPVSNPAPPPNLASASNSAPRPTAAPTADDELPADYVVRAGDTLTKIAKRFGMTPEELAKINGKPLRKMDVLWVGQKIKLRK